MAAETARARRAAGRGEAGEQPAPAREGRDAGGGAGAVRGLILGEIGTETALGSGHESGAQVLCMFITEVAALDRRRGTAWRMLAKGLRESGVAEAGGEVHAIVRKHAAQQHDMRRWCEGLGMKEAEEPGEAEWAGYRPRAGAREQQEAYMHGAAAAVLRVLEQRGYDEGATEVGMRWAAGAEKDILPAAGGVRAQAVKIMKGVHEAIDGSHAGRTFDTREVIPRRARGGFSVIATRATQARGRAAGASGGGTAEASGQEEEAGRRAGEAQPNEDGMATEWAAAEIEEMEEEMENAMWEGEGEGGAERKAEG